MRFLEAALERELGKASVRILGADPVLGGCVHDARRLDTTAGTFFAKWTDSGPADIFVCEASGLDALRAAALGLVIPRVIAASEPKDRHPAFLILEYLSPESTTRPQDEALGRGLAAIHALHSNRFGFATPSYCGLTTQDNAWRDSWPEFYREQRLRPLLETLASRGVLSLNDRARSDRLLDILPSLLPANSTPSLIHGDLWSGNVLRTDRGPGLVDPACAFAEREFEFGITTLFGGLSLRAFDAYQDVQPLAADWRERNSLYQLYHLLNHAVLFGGGYLSQALGIARRFVG